MHMHIEYQSSYFHNSYSINHPSSSVDDFSILNFIFWISLMMIFFIKLIYLTIFNDFSISNLPLIWKLYNIDVHFTLVIKICWPALKGSLVVFFYSNVFPRMPSNSSNHRVYVMWWLSKSLSYRMKHCCIIDYNVIIYRKSSLDCKLICEVPFFVWVYLNELILIFRMVEIWRQC